jgi:4a-hydroxytetrahydrobiopterin dehydratase
MEKLQQTDIEHRLAGKVGWNQEDMKWLVKKYRFPSFAAAMHFVNAVAEIAERENHHPFISIDFKLVTIKITSWKSAGITDLDFRCIAQFDSVFSGE